MTAALLGFLAIFVMALARIPLAFAMGAVGVVGIGLTRGWTPAVASAAQVVYETGFAYTLSVVPLFVPGAQWMSAWLPDWVAGRVDLHGAAEGAALLSPAGLPTLPGTTSPVSDLPLPELLEPAKPSSPGD